MAQKKGHQEPDLSATVEEAEEGDVLELDEAWSFVGEKANKRWLWTAMCRRTRQIVAFAIGDRSAKTCARLWAKIPEGYRVCRSFSDFWRAYFWRAYFWRAYFWRAYFWRAYGQVFSSKTHEQVEKDAGEVAHMERFYCTLRQRLARYVRKTLSFSKSERMHHLVTKWFIAAYNRERSLIL